MARVNSQQSFTALAQPDKEIGGNSPSSLLWFLPAWAVSAPWFCALVCFLSGLVGSAVLAVFLPTRADEEDDIRSFTSFAIGAFMCSFLLKKFPIHSSASVQDKLVSSPRPREVVTTKKLAFLQEASASHDECQDSIAHWPSPPGLGLDLPSFVPPPGLALPLSSLPFAAPPRLERPAGPARPTGVLPPWRLRSAARPVCPREVAEERLPYAPQTFRKEVIAMMRELAMHRNVALAVRQVRLRGVPVDRQAPEVADILTYALEDVRGAARRIYVAFVVGLAGAFEKTEWVAGVKLFFDGIYVDLCNEVPKLPKLIKIELVPTLRSVLSAGELAECVPESVIAA